MRFYVEKLYTASFNLGGEQIKKQPIVYCAWSGGKCLYVGLSERGIARPFSNPTITKNLKRISRITVWICPTMEAAAKLEFTKIREYCPELNLALTKGYSPWGQKLKKQKESKNARNAMKTSGLLNAGK